MARSEHLPIFAEAYRLALLMEQQVAKFARVHRHGLGDDLRSLCRQILRLVIRANNSVDKLPVLQQLRVAVEEFFVLLRLAKDLQHAASYRWRTAIEARFPWLGYLFQLDATQRVQRRAMTTASFVSLRAQYRQLRKQFPQARHLFRIGCFWEAFGADARWLQHSLKLKRGRFRVGLGVGAGMRAWDALYRTPSNTATAYWRQKPTFAGRVRARELALLRIPHAMLSAITPWRFWLAPRPTPRKPRTVKP